MSFVITDPVLGHFQGFRPSATGRLRPVAYWTEHPSEAVRYSTRDEARVAFETVRTCARFCRIEERNA